MNPNITPQRTPSHRTTVLVLTSIASFMVALDTLVVSTSLSTIRTHLHASVAQLEWTVNAYSLSFAVLILTAAALGDRFGRRRMFAIGLAVFVAGSAACAVSADVGWLIGARAVQGAGAALVLPLALALLSASFPPEKRGLALGLFGGITGLAVSSGPLVGGGIVEGIAWQWVFWVNVPIGLALIPLALRRIDESFGSDTSLDVRGLGLVTAGALGIVWGLVRGNSAGWASAEVLLALGAGVALIGAFVAWELRAAEPMLPMGFFRSRAFSAGNAAVFCLFASLFGSVFFMAQFFQTGLGYGPLGTGLRLLPWTAMPMLVTPLAGALAGRYGERPFLAGGLLLQAAGLGWVALLVEPGRPYGDLLAPLVVAGIGVSMAIPAAQNAVIGSVAPEAIGKASGTNAMMRELGGVFGIAILVAVFAGSGSFASARAFADGFAPALAVSAGLSLAGAVVALAMTHRTAPQAIAAVPLASGSTS